MKAIKKITAMAMALAISSASAGMTAFADNVDVNVSAVNVVAEGEEQEPQILTKTIDTLEITMKIYDSESQNNEVVIKDLKSGIIAQYKNNEIYYDGTVIQEDDNSTDSDDNYVATEEDISFLFTMMIVLSSISIETVNFSDNVTEIKDLTIEGGQVSENLDVRFGKNIKVITSELINMPDANITIYGYKGTAAETYALENDYPFIALDKTASTDNTGDVNSDGTVDSSDASQVLAEYAKVQTGEALTFTDVQAESADVNIDGVIDASDASKILAYYSAVSTGKTPSWV